MYSQLLVAACQAPAGPSYQAQRLHPGSLPPDNQHTTALCHTPNRNLACVHPLVPLLGVSALLHCCWKCWDKPVSLQQTLRLQQTLGLQHAF
jgi:hypothetical protein